MKIHHLRNATLIIEAGENFILIDPMLGNIGTIPAFSYIRYKAKKNPTVGLPTNSAALLEKVTHCLLTHKHEDHIDKAGVQFLSERNIAVVCSYKDEGLFKKKGLNIVQTLRYFKEETYLNGTITGIPAKHGYGFIAKPMGNVMGFYIKIENNPSIYISADTIYTEAVEKVLVEFKPDISVVACGRAQLDIGKPLLMTLEEIVRFVRNAPGKVIANHLEALNHCPMTRKQLRDRLVLENLIDKVCIPEDGETIVFN